MSTTSESSTSEPWTSGFWYSEPIDETTSFEAIKAKIGRYYSLEGIEPSPIHDLLRPCTTSRASILHKAQLERIIEYELFRKQTLCVRFDFVAETYESMPIMMCRDEGSYEEFAEELAWFLERHGFKDVSKKAAHFRLKYWGYETMHGEPWLRWEGIVPAFWKDRGTLNGVRVKCEADGDPKPTSSAEAMDGSSL